MAAKKMLSKSSQDDPDWELAERLEYLTHPIALKTEIDGAQSVALPLQEFRELMHHLRSLLTVVSALDEESLTMEEFVAELRADGLLQA